MHVETTASMETVLADQFLKQQERMRYLEEENARTMAENAMLGDNSMISMKNPMTQTTKISKGKADGRKMRKMGKVRFERPIATGFEIKCG